MIRITIEEITPPQPMPRDAMNSRRGDDVLYPHETFGKEQVTVLLRQEFGGGTEKPDVQAIIAQLNHLKQDEPCADCGHEKALHVGGIGQYSVRDSLTRNECRCVNYMTQQMKANRGAVIAAEKAIKEREEFHDALVNIQHKMEGQAQRIENMNRGSQLSKEVIWDLEKKLKAARKTIRGLR